MLKWFRRLSLFKWHNNQIKEWKEACKELSTALHEERRHKNVLQSRIDEWIQRDKERINMGVDRTNSYLRSLEAHANYQAKLLNWINAYMKTVHPNILETAKDRVKR